MRKKIEIWLEENEFAHKNARQKLWSMFTGVLLALGWVVFHANFYLMIDGGIHETVHENKANKKQAKQKSADNFSSKERLDDLL